MRDKIKCIHCGTKENHTKKGFRNTKNRGKIQKYYCLECKKYFTNDEGFYRMRNNEKIITMSIDMYLSNLSSRKMRNQLTRHMETKISHVSILDWVRRYTLKVHKFVNKLQPKLSGKVYADETFIDCQNRKDRLWVAVDWDTRFISGTHYSLSGNIEEAKNFLKNLKKKNIPKFVQTDSAWFYPKAMRKVFSTHKNYTNRTKHLINNVSRTKRHNVRIETVFMKIKDRVDDFRGLKALWSAPILLTGLILQHNYIENHTTTKTIPCELAGINLGAGINKWLELIKLSSI